MRISPCLQRETDSMSLAGGWVSRIDPAGRPAKSGPRAPARRPAGARRGMVMTGSPTTVEQQQQRRGRQGRRRGRILAATIASAGLALGVVATQAGSPALAHSRHHHSAFVQRNLVSDLAGRAELLDPAVKNPWGIAFGPNTPLWVSNDSNPAANCGEGCTPRPEDLLTQVTLYTGATKAHPQVAKVPVEVTASSPTGIVFNPSSSFLIDQGQGAGPEPARFMFNETFLDANGGPEGRITGWSRAAEGDQPPATTKTDASQPGLFPSGLALVPGEGHRHPMLLVAKFDSPSITIYDEEFRDQSAQGRFVDPGAADAGFVPYNVMYLKGRVYVTYTDNVSISAHSVFKPSGRFIRRLHSNDEKGPLVGPWGMAIAPEHWGRFGGDLLVGNVFDGKIHAFNRYNGHLEGTLNNAAGDPLVNIGLWGLQFGNGVIGNHRTLVFSAGIGSGPDGGPASPTDDDTYAHGLVGLIQPARHHHD